MLAVAPTVRLATPQDLPRLREVERAAGIAFRAIGMDEVADDEPASQEVLLGYQRAAHCWVVVDDHDEPVAYALVDLVDGAAHVEQLSVDPEWAGNRLGSRLLQTISDWSRAGGLPAVTLTTFAEVPWNGPYYARLGFRNVAPEDLSPGLRHVRAEETARGLDRWPRVVMRREVS